MAMTAFCHGLTSSDGGTAPPCWICLSSEGIPAHPCACPRAAHPRCLARWQLQQAGRPEEVECRFCGAGYGDWREQLAPDPGLAPATPVMAVNAGGRVHKIRVQPGPEGKAAFRREVRVNLG
ncbi:hypothetical protein MNEG_1588 [Monoraphidium neglectum]|uniref:RING-CH-type domain-containing protein n=1 Tax=Monoraphidium neglectum TaxID=145388 RepID=A0A0D2NPK6_9CHLO|nr:hypothetical protein MNEG_1588 [Monoraphidium neglectum]KIZ06361.1 hypothetical protein MNEG_1588 [Monoraphidium neglectum]|eukprot:XP_013905380.1 hypothetical protein MNEG_1588 [Monoraphidium neglectum]